MAGEFASAEGGELQPLDPGQPDQLGQQRPQRVTAVQRIGPVAGHQRHPTRPQGAGQEGDQVVAGQTVVGELGGGAFGLGGKQVSIGSVQRVCSLGSSSP